jgi:hypothetical protein
VSLLGAGETPSDDHGCGQATPEIGIPTTPAIDLQAGSHGIIYAIAQSKDANGHHYHRLHADVDGTTWRAGRNPDDLSGTMLSLALGLLGLFLPNNSAKCCNLDIDLVHGHFVETLALRVLLQSLEGGQRRYGFRASI